MLSMNRVSKDYPTLEAAKARAQEQANKTGKTIDVDVVYRDEQDRFAGQGTVASVKPQQTRCAQKPRAKKPTMKQVAPVDPWRSQLFGSGRL